MKYPKTCKSLCAAALAALCCAASSVLADPLQAFFYNRHDALNYSIAENLRTLAEAQGVELNIAFGNGQQEDLANFLAETENEPTAGLIVFVKNRDAAAEPVHEAAKRNLPVIFISSDPGDKAMEGYRNSWYVGNNNSQAGTLQADILSKYLKSNAVWDVNGDGQLNYVLFKGENGHVATVARTKTFKAQLRKLGIKSKAVEEEFCNWKSDCTRTAMDDYIKTTGLENIEAVICNNDQMALGVVESLQSHDYNMGISNQYVPVIGVDGISDALKRIEGGSMYGTVMRDAHAMAEVTLKLATLLTQGGESAVTRDALGLEVGRDRRIYTPYKLIYRNLGEVLNEQPQEN